MGRAKRPSPKKLSRKLKNVRLRLGLTQAEMARELKARSRSSSVHQGHVSEFERGEREPSLLVLLAYSRLAGVAMEALVDDALSM